MHVCARVYFWLWPLPPLHDPLLHLAEQPQQEVMTPDLALTGGVKVLVRKKVNGTVTVTIQSPRYVSLREVQTQ